MSNEETTTNVDRVAYTMLPCIWDFSDRENIRVTGESLSRALKHMIDAGEVSIPPQDLVDRVKELEASLHDMIEIARQDEWDMAITGRQVVFRSAQSILLNKHNP